MSQRVYKRKFDWDEARRLRADGLTYSKIGEILGVSKTAIEYACKPEVYQRMLARNAVRQRGGTCPDCDGPMSHNYTTPAQRCKSCNTKALAKSMTKVRDGKAYCPDCDTWKPLADFSPSNRHPARGVHTVCRACDTARRRDYRKRNRERENTYSREYKRRKRQAERQAAA